MVGSWGHEPGHKGIRQIEKQKAERLLDGNGNPDCCAVGKVAKAKTSGVGVNSQNKC